MNYTTEITTFSDLNKYGLEIVTKIDPLKDYAEIALNIKREDIYNFNTFFTDSNSLVHMGRTVGGSPLFAQSKYCQEFFPSCDYYPMTSSAYVQDLADKTTSMM